jgi:hypothetical protein
MVNALVMVSVHGECAGHDECARHDECLGQQRCRSENAHSGTAFLKRS